MMRWCGNNGYSEIVMMMLQWEGFGDSGHCRVVMVDVIS